MNAAGQPVEQGGALTWLAVDLVLDSAWQRLMGTAWPALVLFAFLLTPATAVTAGAQTVVMVKAARLIDGRGGPPLAPAMVRIAGETIEEVAPSLTVPAGATVIDLGDSTLLPGLSTYTHI
jgi:hypothetical protein